MITDAKLQEVIDINNRFYDVTARHFSQTRQHPWKGWKRVLDLDFGKDTGSIKVLDLGCGNGRFYKFLRDNLSNIFVNYTGIDNNNKFLRESRELYPEAEFINGCIFTENNDYEKDNDIIVAFGVTHHLPSKEHVFAWIKEIMNFTEKYSLISFWSPQINNKFKRFGKNLYIRNWDNKPLYRTYLNITHNDINNIVNRLDNIKYDVYEEDKSVYLLITKK